MAETSKNLFRKETMDRISSPEQLTNYLRVTSVGTWVVMIAVMVLLGGLLAWASVGSLETKAQVRVMVENHTAQIAPTGAEILDIGMPLRIASQTFEITSVETDEFGRNLGIAEVSVPDGIYDGEVVIDSTRPIEFLLESR